MSSPFRAGNLSSKRVLPESTHYQQDTSDKLVLPDQFIRRPDVIKLSGLSSATIYRWMKTGKFPQSIHLGEKTTVWSLNELTDWMETLKQGREL